MKVLSTEQFINENKAEIERKQTVFAKGKKHV